MKAKFKVGDRVRLTDDNGGYGAKGAEGTVHTVYSDYVLVSFDRKFRDGNTWYVKRDGKNIELIPSKPTLADDISFKPSTRRILAHLKARGSITVLEALAAYGTARIAPAIHDLREGGYNIETVKKADAGGHNYTRYVLAA
jgi:hypothetical protein